MADTDYFVIVPVMVLSCMKLNRKMKKAFAAQRYQIGELNARIEDTLLGQKVVKAFTNEDMENQKFDADNHSFFGIKKESNFATISIILIPCRFV